MDADWPASLLFWLRDDPVANQVAHAPAHISEELGAVLLPGGVSSRVGSLGGLVCVFRVAFTFCIFGSTHDYGLNCARPFVLWFHSLKEEKKKTRGRVLLKKLI